MTSHGVARTTRVRTEEQRLQDLDKIKTYRALEDQIRAEAASGAFGLALFQLTTKLLRLNPEYYTVWNIRRRCLLADILSRRPDLDQDQAPGAENQESDGDILQSELAFTIPLLTGFPKCYWIWDFRQWILSEAIRRLPAPAACKIWETELGLTSKMLSKDQRNYHAWSYRRFVVAKLETTELRGKSMVEEEFAYSTKKIQADLSNFSAWHNRSQLIPRLLEERGADSKARAVFLEQELTLVRDGLNVGPLDQSLWYYHQYLVSQIVDIANPKSVVPALTLEERASYLKHEIEEIKDLLEDYADIKWIYEALLECTLALLVLEQPTEKHDARIRDLHTWLDTLRVLDPMRAGRWDDVGKELGTQGL